MSFFTNLKLAVRLRSTEEISGSTQEIAASAQELARTTEQLQQLVSRFRVTA